VLAPVPLPRRRRRDKKALTDVGQSHVAQVLPDTSEGSVDDLC